MNAVSPESRRRGGCSDEDDESQAKGDVTCFSLRKASDFSSQRANFELKKQAGMPINYRNHTVMKSTRSETTIGSTKRWNFASDGLDAVLV